MTIDIERVRAETPLEPGLIHLNNAGASPMPDPVWAVVRDHLERERAIGGYEAAAEAADRLEGFHTSVARLLNASPEEIAFVENATRAWDMAFYALPFRDGDRILTAEAEYASNVLAFLQVARRTGAVVEKVPSDSGGALDVEALERMIDGRVRLIAVTHVPTQGGLVNPAAEIGRVARRHGVLYLLDACQSAGQMPLDVEEIGCDMLSGTGRKYLRGPRGTGFLYVKRDLIEGLEPPLIDLHAASWVEGDRYELRPDAKRFENWERFVAGQAGLGAAVDYALDLGLDAIRERVTMLAERLRERLTVHGAAVHDLGRERAGLVTFRVAGEEAQATRDRLAAARVNVSVSRASSSRWDLPTRGLDAVVRASVHYFNTEDEIDRAAEVVAGSA